jgi:hypothetical protein
VLSLIAKPAADCQFLRLCPIVLRLETSLLGEANGTNCRQQTDP